jgi:Domain of unknown function (DUF4382)
MQYLNRIFLLGLALLLAACGGGGSGGGSNGVAVPAAQTGTVTLTMSDATVDGYSQIIMGINQIRFLSDGGQDVLVLDEPREVDFLSLSNFSEVLFKRDVVAGAYSKIRLILDSLTLVKEDGSRTSVDLHGLKKIDINPQGLFTIRGGQYIVINVDLDLDRSIHIVQAGNSGRVNFRPVIFATISTVDAFDKLFRVEGRIDSIDDSANTLNVCDIRRVSDDGARSPNPKEICVFTDPDDATSYFDQESIPLEGGFGGLAVNDPVVMYGKFDPSAMNDTFIPAVIAIGSRDTFVRERGISSEFVPDPDAMDPSDPGTMNLDQVNDICLLTPDERTVSVAEQTAVFSEDMNGDATRVTREQIERCRATEAEGTAVSDSTDGDYLRSFIVLQGATVVAEEELLGTLTAVAPTLDGELGEYTLAPTDMSADRCVIVDDATHMVEIETSGDTSTTTELDTVPTGVEVTVIGVPNDADCVVASDVIHEVTTP